MENVTVILNKKNRILFEKWKTNLETEHFYKQVKKKEFSVKSITDNLNITKKL